MVKIFIISIQTLITIPPHSLNNYRLLMMGICTQGTGEGEGSSYNGLYGKAPPGKGRDFTS